MKKNPFYLLLFLVTFLLYACPNVDPNDNPIEVPNCKVNLENNALGVDTTFVSDDGQVNIGFVWDEIPGAVEYSIVVTPEGGESYPPTSTGQTTVIVPTSLELNQPFTANLTALMEDKATCGPLFYTSTYCNGGGTVDDVFRSPDWEFLCSESTCDFLRFRSRDIEDCDGLLVDPLPWRLRGGNYYRRADVCDCLTSRGTTPVCDGVKALRLNTCLESLTKCLKHDYQPCGE